MQSKTNGHIAPIRQIEEGELRLQDEAQTMLESWRLGDWGQLTAQNMASFYRWLAEELEKFTASVAR